MMRYRDGAGGEVTPVVYEFGQITKSPSLPGPPHHHPQSWNETSSWVHCGSRGVRVRKERMGKQRGHRWSANNHGPSLPGFSLGCLLLLQSKTRGGAEFFWFSRQPPLQMAKWQLPSWCRNSHTQATWNNPIWICHRPLKPLTPPTGTWLSLNKFQLPFLHDHTLGHVLPRSFLDEASLLVSDQQPQTTTALSQCPLKSNRY